MQANFLKALVPSFLLLCLPACLSRTQIQADVWLQSGITADLCAKYPEVAAEGIYRVLDEATCNAQGKPPGCIEFISYCAIGDDKLPVVQHYFNIQDAEFNNILDQLLPKANNSK